MTHPQTRPKSAVVTNADDNENNNSFEEWFEEDKNPYESFELL